MVSGNQTQALQRVFRRKELFRGSACSSLIWSTLASLTLIVLLCDLFLIVDLLQSRGSVVLGSRQEAAELARYLDAESRLTPRENLGIAASAWRLRHTPAGEWLFGLTRRYPLLGDNSGALALLVLAGVAIGFFRSIFLGRAFKAATRTGLETVNRLRRSLHRQALRLGPGDMLNTGDKYVFQLFTENIDRVQKGITLWVYRIGRYPLELALLLGLACAVQWRVTLQCLIPLGVCWYLLRRENLRLQAVRKTAATDVDAELRLLAEGLRKTRLVRGYEMEDYEHEQFNHHLARFQDNVLKINRLENWSRWLGVSLVTVCLAIVLLLLGFKVLQPEGLPGSLTFSSAFLLSAAILCLVRPLEALWDLPSRLSDASVSAAGIFRYLDQIPEVSQAAGAKFLQPLEKKLQFDSVSYTLPDRKTVLEKLTLEIPAGQTAALVSLDPLEPRCLAYLLPRFIDPHAGRILFDGEDIGWATLESLRAETVYVGGTDPFFTGTVKENISCGNPEYPLQSIVDAAKAAHAHHFIQKLPQGYEMMLGEHGEQLDGGQAYRLGLARALLRDPALMIIEEPNVPLDEDTKSMLDDTYNRIVEGRTVLFLPSRLSTVKRADRIVFLHRGRLEASGTHEQLLRSSPLYRHWEYIRFNEFRRETEPAGSVPI